jgi:hypothetical protein
VSRPEICRGFLAALLESVSPLPKRWETLGLLFLWYSYNPIVKLVDPPIRKALALVVVLLLSVGAFLLLAGGEAQAKEQPSTAVKQSKGTTDGEATPSSQLQPVPPTKEAPPPKETPPAKDPSSPPLPAAPKPGPDWQPVQQPEPQQSEVVITNGEAFESGSVPDRPAAETQWVPYPEPPLSNTTYAPGTDLAPPPVQSGTEHVPASAFYPAPSSDVSDALPPDDQASKSAVGPSSSQPPLEPEEASPSPFVAPTSSAGVGPAVPAKMNIDKPPAVSTAQPSRWAAITIPVSSSVVGGASRHSSSFGAVTAKAVSSTVQSIKSTAEGFLGTLPGGGGGSPDPSPDVTQNPADSTPPTQPELPIAPTPIGGGGGGGGSSFSLSGNGQLGSGGGFTPLVLGMLVLSSTLLRRDFRMYLVSCKVPKPSSALLMPLERPG